MVNLLEKDKSKRHVMILGYSFLTFSIVNILINSLELTGVNAASLFRNIEKTPEEIEISSFLEKAKDDLEDIILRADEAEKTARDGGASPSTIKNLKAKWKNKIKEAERRVEKEENLLEARRMEIMSRRAEEEKNRLIKEETKKRRMEEARKKIIREVELAEEEMLWQEVEGMLAEEKNRLRNSMSSGTFKNVVQKQKKDRRKLRRKTDNEEIQRKELEREEAERRALEEKEARDRNILIMRTKSKNVWEAATIGLGGGSLGSMGGE